MLPQPPRSTLFPYTNALPISLVHQTAQHAQQLADVLEVQTGRRLVEHIHGPAGRTPLQDRKSTRLNSSHVEISYAVFCLKKKKAQAQAFESKFTHAVS